MPDNPDPSKRRAPFGGAVDKSHRRVDPCFMTGKGCVYTEIIERSLRERRDQNRYLGFSVMPFRDNLNVFFKNCLSLFFSSNYGSEVTLQRADEVRRPGIIICEGICKRIQESDFLTVDISISNPNVFYELGLAYGIGHKIVVIYHDRSPFGKQMAEHLKGLGCKAYAYHDLDPIPREEFDRQQYVWRKPYADTRINTYNEQILLYEHHILQDEEAKATDPTPDRDILLDFRTHVRSAVGLAVVQICEELEENRQSQRVIHSYLSTIRGFKDVATVKTDSSLKEIQDQVECAYCLIIRTGFKTCHPMAYFWLGYGHARGKNVVPVTVLHERNESVRDLAFDIRAQRHMFFIRKYPEMFERELKSSLGQMIVADFSEWSRKRFWDIMLGRRGEVSIFTGALHNETFGREMIGDWDLRAASELTSYLARQQYRAKIENPVYAPEYPKRDPHAPEDAYISTLKEMLTDKNCILIASPDVNPLTEIVFGHIYNVPDAQLFKESTDIKEHPNAIVVVKEKPKVPDEAKGSTAKRFFYRDIPQQENLQPKRGFESAQLIAGRMMENFVSQVDNETKEFRVFGHVAILRNPFRLADQSHERYIIVLNGVSGPATFALTHVLTGGITKEFVSYEESFDPEAESEEILRKLLDYSSRPGFTPLDLLITVKVGVAKERAKPTQVEISDWRRILGWELNTSARQTPIKGLP